jgi:hypothetical protein
VHELTTKLDQAAACGFQGNEILDEDLEYHAKSIGNLSDNKILEVVRQIKKMCDDRDLIVHMTATSHSGPSGRIRA